MRFQQLSLCFKMLGIIIGVSISAVSVLGISSIGVYEGAAFSPEIEVMTSTESTIRLNIEMPNLPPTSQQLDIEGPFEGLVANMLLPEENPLIPRFTIFLALPRTGNPSVVVETWQTDTYSVTAPANIPENDPSRPEVRLGEIQVLGGIRVVPLTVKPVEYTNNSSTCTVMTDAVVRIDIDGSQGTLPQSAYPESFSVPWQKVLRSVATNWEAIPNIHNGARSHLLIICPDEYEMLIQGFVEWKEQRGMTVTVVLKSEISANPSSFQIRQRIEFEYENSSPRIDHVLLVGDENKLAPAYRFTEDPISRFSNYSYTDGSFTDENHFAAIGDNDDYDVFPEVFVGRWVVNSQSEVVSVANRSIFHERDVITSNSDRFTRSTMGADFTEDTQIITKRHVREMLLDHGFVQVDTLWDENFPPSPQPMIDWINQGVTFVNYRGSGWNHGWAGINFYISEIFDISNTGRLPIVTGIGCGVGKFDVDDNNCFGEVWMTHGSATQPSGAVGFIGPCWNTHTVYNDCLDSSLYRAILDYEVPNLAAAFTAGKVYTWGLFEEFLTEEAVFELCKTMIRQYLVLSDPSLQLFTQVPVQPVVNLPDAIMAGQFDLEITIENMASLPADSLLLTVWYEQGSFDNHWLRQGTPTVTILLNAQNDQTVSFTLTGENVAPFQRSIEVSPTGPYVIHQDFEISDSPNGNGNGLIEPGETITWNETVWNVGTETADNVVATLSSESPGVSITGHSLEYGTLSSGQIVTSTSSFVFDVIPAAPEEDRIQFAILFTADNAEPRYSEIGMALHAPDLSFQFVEIEDGNNGILERWESADLQLTFKNEGNLASRDGSIRLLSQDSYLNFIEDESPLSGIPMNSSGMTPSGALRIHAAGNTPSGHIAEIIAHVEFEMDNYTYSRDIPFTVIIGRVESTDPLNDSSDRYWLYDNSDTIYSQAPEFEWIEISPSAGGPGTLIDIEPFFETVTIDVPFSYTYYGVEYQNLAVSADGWVQPGPSIASSPFHETLPYRWDSVHGMIAPLWADLWLVNQDETGDLSYYYDETSDRFIVEWYQIHNNWFVTFVETFQIHLLNPGSYPTPTGDAEWLFMYGDVSDIVNSSQGYTIGIENQSSLEGITYVSRNAYAPAASRIVSGSVIRVTTESPSILDTGITPIEVPSTISLEQNYPNPFNPSTRISFSVPAVMPVRLEVFNILGQRVVTLLDKTIDAGTHTVIWDGKSNTGVLAGSGVYLYRLSTPESVLSRKMVLLK